MVWSYSRITTYETCPYRFLLTYILKLDRKRLFFSDYGLFMHSIIEKYLNGSLKRNELDKYFLFEFQNNVISKAPNISIFKNYFQQGLSYTKNFYFPYQNISAIESKVEFKVGNKNFVGFIDAVAEDDDGTIIIDNKSRNLKQRSNRKKTTNTDKELDKYLRQLYIYSIAIKQNKGVLPSKLCFNCFRTGTIILEDFSQEKYNETQEWALKTIDAISDEHDWLPNVNYFVCKNLCDVCHHCDYSRLSERR